jgi:hypothetical protein
VPVPAVPVPAVPVPAVPVPAVPVPAVPVPAVPVPAVPVPAVPDPALPDAPAVVVAQSVSEPSGDSARVSPSTSVGATAVVQAGDSAIQRQAQAVTSRQESNSEPAGDAGQVLVASGLPAVAGAGQTADEGKTKGAGETIESGVLGGPLSLRADAAPAEVSASGAGLAAAGRVGAVESMPEPRQIGLLAVIAGVFALGVGVAVIRAFKAERAYTAMLP